MAGSAILRALERAGYHQLLVASRSELDLLDGSAVEAWFAKQKPTVVVLAAAKVGGISANSNYPADFLLENLKIQNHVIETAWRSGVRRLLFLGSIVSTRSSPSSRFVKKLYLLESWNLLTSGTRSPKLLGLNSVKRFASSMVSTRSALCLLISTGLSDNYHPTNSHVLPALIRRFHEAVESKAAKVTCWGTGAPMRELLHADDLGEACVRPREMEPGPR